jgi:protein SCO1/2
LIVKRLAPLALLGLLLVTACQDASRGFKNTDITGASYGKELALLDHHGTHRTLADYKGKAVVVFFGYTHCPDVCPTTLAEMKAALARLGEDAKRVQVLFVTVDPERDTRDVLAQYVPAFDPSFVGLYGDADTTAKVAKDFKVFYQKVAGSRAETYTVDHTAGSYIFDPQGRLRLYVRYGASPDDLAADLRQLLAGR